MKCLGGSGSLVYTGTSEMSMDGIPCLGDMLVHDQGVTCLLWSHIVTRDQVK